MFSSDYTVYGIKNFGCSKWTMLPWPPDQLCIIFIYSKYIFLYNVYLFSMSIMQFYFETENVFNFLVSLLHEGQ